MPGRPARVAIFNVTGCDSPMVLPTAVATCSNAPGVIPEPQHVRLRARLSVKRCICSNQPDTLNTRRLR